MIVFGGGGMLSNTVYYSVCYYNFYNAFFLFFYISHLISKGSQNNPHFICICTRSHDLFVWRKVSLTSPEDKQAYPYSSYQRFMVLPVIKIQEMKVIFQVLPIQFPASISVTHSCCVWDTLFSFIYDKGRIINWESLCSKSFFNDMLENVT